LTQKQQIVLNSLAKAHTDKTSNDFFFILGSEV